jgi:hypothetical protein
MRTPESFIENNVIRNRHLLGYRDSVFIRRCRMGRGFGVADVALLPLRGRQRLVVIEAKQGGAQDATSKVVGQLLMYYAGALCFGARGIRHLRHFATEKPRHARSTNPKSLKMLSGGLSRDDAWTELQKGHKVQPHQVDLYVALDSLPSPGLTSALEALAAHHELPVGVVSVLGRDRLEIWRPS